MTPGRADAPASPAGQSEFAARPAGENLDLTLRYRTGSGDQTKPVTLTPGEARGWSDVLVFEPSVSDEASRTLLQAISDETGGTYYAAASEDELMKIYSDLKPKLTVKTEDMEVTSIFAGVGMLAFLVGGALSLLWFGRVP